MRITDYLRIAGKDLRRQPVRASLTATALAISTAILVTLATLSLGARQAIITTLSPDNSLTTILVTSSKASSTSLFGNIQEANQHTSKLDDESVGKVAAIPHVQFASPRAHVWEFNTFKVEGADKEFVAQTEAIGAEPAASMPLAAGRGFTKDSKAHEVVIGAAYAKDLGYEHNPQGLVGKTVTVTTQKGYRGEGATIPGPTADQAANDKFNDTTTTLKANIVGVTTNGSNQNRLFIPMEWARQVRGAHYWQSLTQQRVIDQLGEAGYTTIVARADTVQDVPSVTGAIDALGYGQVSTLAAVQKMMTLSTVMWVILGSVALVALIAASLGIVNTMLMAVAEQRYVIGVWRASGARKGQIARMFLLQAIILGLVGGGIGAAAGFGVSQFAGDRIAGLLQAQNLAAVQIPLAPWWLLMGSVGLTVLFSVLAGLYPAVAAARQDPAKALAAQQ